MGFESSSCSFTRFYILDQLDDDIAIQIPDLLRKHAFKDIEDLPEMRSHGWVCFEDMLDTEWTTAPPQKGQYAIFSLRLDTRRIPAGVIKKHVALALREEKERMLEKGQKFISRERKKEIKESIILKLRQRFLPIPAEFNVMWNLVSGEVWFASVQPKMIDLFMEEFLNTFGLRLEQLTPYSLAARMLGEDQTAVLDALEATRFINPETEEQI